MTFFQYNTFSLVNLAIKRVVKHIIAKEQCSVATFPNNTFWKKTPRGDEIVIFFNRMTQQQIIHFFGCFDIFVVGFHNGINAYVEMTADPSSLNFEKTLRISISKSYTQFSQNFSRRATPSIEGDLRNSIVWLFVIPLKKSKISWPLWVSFQKFAFLRFARKHYFFAFDLICLTIRVIAWLTNENDLNWKNIIVFL